jgi:autotransporter translocation and assembly factor TamB
LAGLFLDRAILLSSPRKILRVVARGFVAVLVLLTVALAAAYAFTFTDRFRELAREQLVGYLKTAYAGDIDVERIEGSIWGALRLRGISIRYGDKQIAALPVVVVRYALLPVLRGTVEVTAIEAPDATFDVAADEQGEWDLMRALGSRTPSPPSDTGSGVDIVLDSVKLTNATIRVTPHGSPTYFLSDAVLDAKIDVRGGGTDADLRTLAFRIAREGLPVVRAETALAYEGSRAPGRAVVRRLTVSTDTSKASLEGDVKNLSSTSDMEVSAKLAIEALSPADVKLFVPQWSATEPIVGGISVDGKMSALRATSSLTVGEAAMQATATADLASTPFRYDAALAVTKLDVGKLVAGLGVAGVVDGKASAKGAGTELIAASGDADVAVHGLAASGWQLGDVTASGTLAARRATLESRVVLDGAERVKLDVDADIAGSDGYRALLVATHFNPKRVAADRVPLAGDLNLRANVEGRGIEPAKASGRAVIVLEASKLGAIAFDGGRFDVAIGGGRAKIAEAWIRAKNASLHASGDVGLAATDKGNVRYEAAVADLRPWLELAGKDGGGAVTVTGSADGTLADLATRGRLRASQLRVDTSTIARAEVEYQAEAIGQKQPRGRVVAAAEKIAAGVSLATLHAELALRDEGRFTADVAATDSAARPHHLAADGVLRAPDVDLRLTDLSLGSSEGPWRLTGPATFTVRKNVLTIGGLELANGGRRVRLAGTVAPRGRQQFRADVDRFTLDTLQPFLTGAPKLGGSVTGSAELSGTAAAPILTVKLAVGSLEIAGQKCDGIDASARYADGTAAADADFRQDATHRLTATAKVPMTVRWDPTWSATSSGDASVVVRSSGLSLAVLNAFTGRTVRDVRGELALDVTATGPIASLRPKGVAELRDGGFVIPAYGSSLQGASVVVRFDEREARVERLFARGPEGTLDGRGLVPLASGDDPIQLTLEAKKFRAASSYRYRADIEGTITVGGTRSAPVVGGRIAVLEAALRPDISFLGKAPKPRDPTIRLVSANEPQAAAPPPEPAAPKPSVYEAASIDVVIAIERNTWIRHEEAAVELEGEVHATKQPNQPLALVGEVHTVHGWASLQGRWFTITRGRVAFTGGKEIDPTLDVVADYKKGEYLVHAIVSGTANAPALTLTSEPQLDQADIVSVLLFGKPASQLNDGQKGQLQQNAAEMAAGYAFSKVGQSVSRALGLESKGIQVEELSPERVALGTYLTEKTYVTVGENIGQKNGQEVSVQYELVPHWSVETSANSVGGSGLDLIWHRTY